MPWKEPGKGGNGKDPWNSGGQQPPDLEQVFEQMNARLRRLFGGGKGRGGSGSGGGIGGYVPFIVLALVAWVLWGSLHIIDESERGVVTRFGKYVRTLDPGFNITLPRPIERLEKVNVSNVRSVEDRGQMLTQDENIVELNYTMQYRILNPQDFLFNVRDPELTVQQAGESALRDAIGNNRLDHILAGVGRVEVVAETERVLQETLELYEAGIQITEFTLKDVNVPSQVRDAFSDVNRAREDRQRYIEEARVHVNSVLPEARGRAARILQEAEGYRDSTIALAEGEADRFDALRTEYQKAPEITRKRMYLQAMEGVMSNTTTVLLDIDSSGNILYLPLDQLSGDGAATTRPVLPPSVLNQNPSNAESQRDSGRSAGREGRE